jgi:hypothetical protein
MCFCAMYLLLDERRIWYTTQISVVRVNVTRVDCIFTKIITFYSNFFLQSTAKEESSLLIVHLVALKSCDSNLLLPFPITRYIYTNRSQLGTKYDI